MTFMMHMLYLSKIYIPTPISVFWSDDIKSNSIAHTYILSVSNNTYYYFQYVKELNLSCGEQTRTADLLVMSQASYQLLHSAMFFL